MDSIPVAILSGTPEELGDQHAALLGSAARQSLEYPQKMFRELGIPFFLPFAISAGNALMTNAPDRYRREIDAAARRGQWEPGTLALANTMLEMSRMGCATLIVEPARSKTGELLFGRNFDFLPLEILDRYSIVKVVRPTGKHAYAEVGYPGLMGVISGMNDAGLCVATLDVYETGDNSALLDPAGVPMMLIFREILEQCRSIDEAQRLLEQTRRTTRANLAVCDTRAGAVLEITPKQVVRRSAPTGVLPCTNHFRSAGLAVSEECWRYEKLVQTERQATLGVAEIKQALHEVNQGRLTLHTMIFEPRELKLHLALGTAPSSRHPLRTLDLKELLSTSRDSEHASAHPSAR